MPVGIDLEPMHGIEHASFVKIVADDLQTDRPSSFSESAGDGHSGEAGEVYADGIDVGQVHLDRIAALGAQVESYAR